MSPPVPSTWQILVIFLWVFFIVIKIFFMKKEDLNLFESEYCNGCILFRATKAIFLQIKVCVRTEQFCVTSVFQTALDLGSFTS